MSITKAEITTVLNARLSRSETAATLAEQIRSALWDLSREARWPDMFTTDSASLSDGDQTIALPSLMRLLDAVTINVGAYQNHALEEIPFEQWLEQRVSQTSGDTDEPIEYAVRGATLYVHPPSDDSYSVQIWYYQYHPDQDEILFGEQFREAIYNGVMVKYLEGLGMEAQPKHKEKLALYHYELGRLLPEAEPGPSIVQYQEV